MFPLDSDKCTCTLENRISTFECFMVYCNDILQHYKTPLSQFLCDLASCLLMCVTYTGYDWLYS